MSRETFSVLVTGLITFRGNVLIGKKIHQEGHPVSEEWHLPGGFLEEGEGVREAVKREIREETGLEIEVHQLIDTYFSEEAGALRVVFHAEAENRDLSPGDDLQDARWVDPSEVEDYMGTDDCTNRDEIRKFLRKLEEMPAF